MARGPKPKIGRKADERPSRELAVPVPTGMVAAGIPPMPFTLPDEAAEAWVIVCSSLPGLAECDLGDVEICVSALHRYRSLCVLLDKSGYTLDQTVIDPVTEEVSTVMIVPDAIVRLDMMRHRAANQYRYHADQLGLSRMSRARLNLLDVAAKSELASLAERVISLRKTAAPAKKRTRRKT